MYRITNNYKNILKLNDFEQAKRLADQLQGIVFIEENDEQVVLYTYED